MGNIKKRNKMIMVPYPAQGHVTPMLKLASAFHNLHGFQAILVIPEFIHCSITSRVDPEDGICCMSIPDGIEKDGPRDFFAIERAMEETMPVHLERLIHQLLDDDEDGGVVCVVVDLVASWAIEVANQCGVPAVGFWTAMVATYRFIAAIPDMLRTGLISADTGCPQHLGTISSSFLPNQAMLSTEDLPWLIGTPAARKARFKFWTRALNRSKTLKWLLANSFPDELMMMMMMINKSSHIHDQGSAATTAAYPLVLPIGPLSQLQHAAPNPSFWEEDMSCLEWLDKMNKPAGSVVYISFGSWVSPIGESKVQSLALALQASGRPFIWVLGLAWRQGLPLGYVETLSNSNQGKVVSWAPQVEVLKHKAVGCYLTHCGWNSTMEAIQCKKRLLCYPVAGDQFVNCNYIVKVWKIGLRLSSLGQKDVEEGLSRVVEDGDHEMSNRLLRLHEMTMAEEARSVVMANLTAFIQDLDNSTANHESS